jgi:hypothetical protein
MLALQGVIMPDPQDISPHAIYAVEGWNLTKLRAVMDRLYKEDRLSGDDMRDAAQLIGSVIRNAYPIRERE